VYVYWIFGVKQVVNESGFPNPDRKWSCVLLQDVTRSFHSLYKFADSMYVSLTGTVKYYVCLGTGLVKTWKRNVCLKN